MRQTGETDTIGFTECSVSLGRNVLGHDGAMHLSVALPQCVRLEVLK